MLTEVTPTVWAVRVQGQIIASGFSSQRLAESSVMNLPPEQRTLAEVIPVTTDGRSILLG